MRKIERKCFGLEAKDDVSIIMSIKNELTRGNLGFLSMSLIYLWWLNNQTFLPTLSLSIKILHVNWFMLTCRWINTTLPNSLQVPPCRSTWSIRRIWRKRMPRIALVANTCPLLPTVSTTNEATTTMRSVWKMNEKIHFNSS